MRRSPTKFRQISDRLAEMAGEAYAKMGQGEFGRFTETFHIPRDVDARDIQSSYEDGILCITLPKRAVRAEMRHHGACRASAGMPQQQQTVFGDFNNLFGGDGAGHSRRSFDCTVLFYVQHSAVK